MKELQQLTRFASKFHKKKERKEVISRETKKEHYILHTELKGVVNVISSERVTVRFKWCPLNLFLIDYVEAVILSFL